ncbi:PEP-CTERM/exosortase system-associated acyltransferase [Alteromonas gracilis]|uniref:PEP-CTERM/exosortase system-associated acyltransferase n=1 Tax=Alteromonas gracilis TaxID=1479524 RepID=UPI003735CF99
MTSTTTPKKRFKKRISSLLAGSVVKKVMANVADKKVREISNYFPHFFTPKVAETEAQRNSTFSIRHDVFSEELGLEQRRETLLESDQFDRYSIHCFLQHRPTGKLAGTVRVVRPKNENQPLPMQHYLDDGFHDEEISPDDFRQDKIAEISRLAVPREFRRKHVKSEYKRRFRSRRSLSNEIQCYPYIAIGLYFTAMSVLLRNNINHAFIMVEPRLAKSLKFIGFPLEQVGPETDYFGRRAPFYIRVKATPFKLGKGFNSLFESIDQTLNHQQIAQQIKKRLR